MSRISRYLRTIRAEHRRQRYAGDLAAELLGEGGGVVVPAGRRNFWRLIAWGLGVGAVAAAVVLAVRPSVPVEPSAAPTVAVVPTTKLELEVAASFDLRFPEASEELTPSLAAPSMSGMGSGTYSLLAPSSEETAEGGTN